MGSRRYADDPWMGMAVEKQFRKIMGPQEPQTPATLLYLLENKDRYKVRDAIETTLTALQRMLYKGRYAKLLRIVLWGDGTPMSVAMSLTVDDPDELIQTAYQFGLA